MDSTCCSPGVARTGAAFSGSLEIAPIFGPFRDIYLSPAAQLRTLWPSQGRARVEYDGLSGDEPNIHEVDFGRPIVTVGLRLTVGVILRARRLWDLGLGVDVGRPVYDADRSLGVALKLGVALGQ